MGVIRNLLTGIDNSTYDIGRVVFLAASVAWLATVAMLLVMAWYRVFRLHQPFDAADFGHAVWFMMLGAAAIHIGSCWGLAVKAGTEPAAGWRDHGESEEMLMAIGSRAARFEVASPTPWNR